MANWKKLIVTLVVLFGGLVLTGCGPKYAWSGDREFESAVCKGDIAKVKAILAENPQKVNAGARNAWQLNPARTPLMDAIQYGQTDVARLLISKGAKVDAKDESGSTPLRLAAQLGRKEIAELLIAKGADLNSKERSGFVGYTPLHFAALYGRKDIVELLIANGANINAGENVDSSPLCSAISSRAALENPENQKEVAKLLIKNGADVNIGYHKGARQGPLHRVVAKGWYEIAKLLIANGADVNARTDQGDTPLHWALNSNHKEIAELLITNGADVNARNNEGHALLRTALRGEFPEIAKLLRRHGAALGIEVHDAAAQGNLDKINSILAENPELVGAKDPGDSPWTSGFTPLHWAACCGHKEVVELLIARGAKVNAKSDKDFTPLHETVRMGHKEVVEFLIAKGADVNAKRAGRYTALQDALRRGHKEIADLLRKHGAKE